MREKHLEIEELSFQEVNREAQHLELPLSRWAFWLVAGLAFVTIVMTFSRLFFLNSVRGGFYTAQSYLNVHKEIVVPAPRGVITDRFGSIIADNKSTFGVYVNLGKILKDRKSFNEAVQVVSSELELDEEEIENIFLGADIEKQPIIKIADDITNEQAIRITALDVEGIQAVDAYSRDYIDGPAFAHVIGYGEDTGIEGFYNDILSGADGIRLVYKDVAGNKLDEILRREPEIGKGISLTIDAGLQKAFYDSLRSGVARVGSSAGVGIALNPKTGEVLSMVSLPSFDNSNVATFLSEPGQPLFNRAILGAYNPGSVIKPLVALAALREKLVDDKKEVLSTGTLEVPNPYYPDEPSIFLDWKPHGWVNIYSAIARSSNVYFYYMGGGYHFHGESFNGLGISKLNDYWSMFKIDEKLGIDLPFEGSGFLPNPDEKEERTGQIWRLGDTYNVSIGQGDLLVTPLGLLSMIASIGNNGIMMKPHLNKSNIPISLLDFSDWKEEIEIVKVGMRDTVQKAYGTAHTLSALPFEFSGKTGSAQISNNTKTNAFFAGYGPSENPEIAILVLVEDAREGSLNTIPIAYEVLEWYYENRMSQKNIESEL